MTPEREKQIRSFKYYGDQADVIPELLSEIDRLRAENERVIGHERNSREFLNEVRVERDKLIDENNQLRDALNNHHKTLVGNLSYYSIDEIRQLREKLAAAEDALKFYAGETNESEWDGAKFLTFDKFGCLADDISGPIVAKEALAKIRGDKHGD